MSYSVYPMREIAIGIFDGPHATPELHDDGVAVFLGITNLTERGSIELSDARYVSEADYPRWTKRVTPKCDDIVFTYEATLNRYAIIPADFKCCLGRRTALIRPDKQKIDHRFLFYYLFTPEWRAQIQANILTGATVDRISLTKFPDFTVRVPSLEIQSRIATVLCPYDDLIAANQRRIQLLEESARLLYREWFVLLRFPGHETVTVTDGVPDGWNLDKLDKAFLLQRGFDLPAADRLDGDVPIYASTGIAGYHNQHKVRGPGVVTGRSGTLGEVHFVHEDFWPLNTALWVKEFKTVTPLIAYFMLKSLDLSTYNAGASVPSLDRKTVHAIDILIPHEGVQGEFEQAVMPLFDQIRAIAKMNSKLTDARDMLLPKLMSGALDVSRIAVPKEVEA